MANKNTKRARRAGFPSMKDAAAKTNPLVKGECVDTRRPEGKRKWVGAARAQKGGEID